jgi:hypothetical protein
MRGINSYHSLTNHFNYNMKTKNYYLFEIARVQSHLKIGYEKEKNIILYLNVAFLELSSFT